MSETKQRRAEERVRAAVQSAWLRHSQYGYGVSALDGDMHLDGENWKTTPEEAWQVALSHPSVQAFERSAEQPLAVEGAPQEETLPAESERRMEKIINYFAGDWKGVPMDKVRQWVRNELMDERDSVASLPPEAPEGAKEWVSVEDRMPDEGQKVWIARTAGGRTSVSGPGLPDLVVSEATFHPDYKFPFSGDGPSVRLWMPREGQPAPPKSEVVAVREAGK